MEIKCNGQRRRRPSSFKMQDSAQVFETLALQPGHVFMDLGCGLGEYALHGARLVGDTGVVYAIDRSMEVIKDLKHQAHRENISNLTAIAADITRSLPIESKSVDHCLLATVLHIPDVAARVGPLCAEIRRVLKPGGRLVIIERHKDRLPFGPPEHMRLSPEEVASMVLKHGIAALMKLDLGCTHLVECVVA